MIRFGPSGIPLSCKGRTLLDGVKDVHKLGLSALEVQFLRMKARTRPAQEEEIDLLAKEVPDKFVIGVNRGTDYQKMHVEDLDKKLEAGDMVHFLRGGVSAEFHQFPEVATLAKELDVKLTLHTPYYVKFTEEGGDQVDKSKRGFKYGSVMAGELDADMVVTHLGIIEDDSNREDVEDVVVKNIREMRDWMTDKYPEGPKLGIEVQTGGDIYGGLDEVLDVCRRVSGTVPVLNFAHIKASGRYDLEEPEDFGNVFDQCRKFVPSDFYVNFSGVKVHSEDEYRSTPIKRGDLDFEPFVDYLLDSDDEVTIISGSPLKEHDAMYMRVIFERMYSKMAAKELRREREDE